MNTRGLTRHHAFILLIAFAVISLFLTACQPADTTSIPVVLPTTTVLPMQTPTTAQPPSSLSGDISLDLSGVAQDQTIEMVAEVPASTDGPWWEVMPQYRRVTLQGYPVTNHLMKAQIFIYPAADLARFNEVAGRMVTDLQAQLQSQQPVDFLPFLPPYNASQVMHAQVRYLDFKNGKGIRFLTQFNQAVLPINNFELFYTFQGLTRDGKYYIAAVLPVTHPELPATEQVTEQQKSELSDFPAYLTRTVAWLEQQSSGSFTPDLAKLDALIQSIEVK